MHQDRKRNGYSGSKTEHNLTVYTPWSCVQPISICALSLTGNKAFWIDRGMAADDPRHQPCAIIRDDAADVLPLSGRHIASGAKQELHSTLGKEKIRTDSYWQAGSRSG
jgi:hypothetical protein